MPDRERSSHQLSNIPVADGREDSLLSQSDGSDGAEGGGGRGGSW